MRKVKVVCIKDFVSHYGFRITKIFKVGEAYEAECTEPNHYNFKIDGQWYRDEYFRDIKYIRKMKINKIVNENR